MCVIEVVSSAWLGSLVWTCNIGLIVGGPPTCIAARATAEGMMAYEFDGLWLLFI